MPGIEQQADVGAGQRHQAVDVLGRLDVGAHVMVVRERDAVLGAQVGPERVQALRVRAPGGVVAKAGRFASGVSMRPWIEPATSP
jgi:hypothetical protein